MNIYKDPEPLAVDTVVDFEGFLTRVSTLENEFRILFRNFEETLEDQEEDDFFNAEILQSYHQPSVYFILQDEDDRGLDCKLLNSSNTQWLNGRIHFQPALIFRQISEKGYNISLIPYEKTTIIEVGHKTIKPDEFMQPFLNHLKNQEKSLSSDLRQFLEKNNKILINPEYISECVDVKILQPGQNWISCKMDLHLSLRLYQAEVEKLSWQASYCNSSKSKNAQVPSKNSLLQIDTYVTPLYDLCCNIANQFSLFEQDYKGRNKYYPACPNLEEKIISKLRMSSKFNLLRGRSDDNGLPCKLLNLNSGNWVEGDLAFELVPQFIPNSNSEDIKSDESNTQITEDYESPLDDIRQSLLNGDD